MTYDEFQELMVIYKNSVTPEIELKAPTVKYWYEHYFKFYEKEVFEKCINQLIKDRVRPVLVDMLQGFKEFYGYNLHEEVEKSLNIMKQAETEQIKVSERVYPKLKDNYSLPISDAWTLAYELRYGGK